MASPPPPLRLRPPYDFGPGDFDRLAQYAAQQPATNTTVYQVAPFVATYASVGQRAQAIAGAQLADQPQYQAGRVVGSVTRYYPSQRGGVGLVASPLQSAAQASLGTTNEWHVVGVLRHQQTVWVYDPSYAVGSQARLRMIPGTSNVTWLLKSAGFGQVDQVQVSGVQSLEQDCMGQSAQWVDSVIQAPRAQALYRPPAFVPGELTPGWQVVQRY